MEETHKIVIEHGSRCMTIGTEDRYEIEPCIAGQVKEQYKSSHSSREYYFGTDINMSHYKYHYGLKISYPYQDGTIVDERAMENFYHHLFYQAIRLVPEQSHVVAIEPINATSKNKQFMLQSFFEKFSVPYLFMPSHAQCCNLYAMNGMVLDLGYRSSRIRMYYDQMDVTSMNMNIPGGCESILQTLGIYLGQQTYSERMDLISQIPKICYHPLLKETMKNITFTTAYDTTTDMNEYSWKPVEELFNNGLVDGIVNALDALPINMREAAQQSCTVTGYISKIPGMGAGLKQALAERGYQCKFLLDNHLHLSTAFQYAQYFVSHDQFTQFACSKDEYYEYGCNVMHFAKQRATAYLGVELHRKRIGVAQQLMEQCKKKQLTDTILQ